jgi:hypothetical protein
MCKLERRILDMKPTLVTSLLIVVIIIMGCGKNASNNSLSNGYGKIGNQLPIKLKTIKLGQAEDFAILAYASISSNPSSSIKGRVGLLPGTKDLITLDPSEVVGGPNDIIGSDDDTIPINLLSNAKVDMVTAYKDAFEFLPDSDKLGLDGDKINGKVLSHGCYKMNGDLTINTDFTLDGTDTDTWIFKIPANFRVANGVHLILAGGAKAKNIFWQVAGSAILESGSAISGTIIAQQFVELRNHSKLDGRAFAKNGYVKLDQAIINKP